MACMCGDTYCWSCGPAQGNSKCREADGGCDKTKGRECPDCEEEIPDVCDDCGKEKKTFMKPNGHNLEEVYGCPECDS